jgi:hypothetical protein
MVMTEGEDGVKEWDEDEDKGKDNNTFADDSPQCYFHSVNMVPKTRYHYDLRLKIACTLPRGKKAANDMPPTVEEITHIKVW